VLAEDLERTRVILRGDDEGLLAHDDPFFLYRLDIARRVEAKHYNGAWQAIDVTAACVARRTGQSHFVHRNRHNLPQARPSLTQPGIRVVRLSAEEGQG
jgi:hypothetical protein